MNARFSLTRQRSVLDTVINGSVSSVEFVSEYWELTEFGGNTTQNPFFNRPTIEVVALNAEIITGLLSSVTSAGIIGFYVGVVLAVGRFLRIALTHLSHRVIYEDMPECEEILQYCQDIYMAREDHDNVLEESLFRELIELYRSPERIILRTDPKGRPRFKAHGTGIGNGKVKKKKKDIAPKESRTGSGKKKRKYSPAGFSPHGTYTAQEVPLEELGMRRKPKKD